MDDFKQYLRSHDIRPTDKILFYDDYGIVGAARSWWLFQVFGIQSQILNGGFKKWIDAGYELETGAVQYKPRVI